MKVETAIGRIMNHKGWGTGYKMLKLDTLGFKYGIGSLERGKVVRVLETFPEYAKYQKKVRATVSGMVG